MLVNRVFSEFLFPCQGVIIWTFLVGHKIDWPVDPRNWVFCIHSLTVWFESLETSKRVSVETQYVGTAFLVSANFILLSPNFILSDYKIAP